MTSRKRGHLIARLMRMRLLRGIGAAGGLAVALAVGVTALPGQAHAACAASPSPSANRFIGTVVRLGADDRQAFVQKVDGTQVEVDGGTVQPGVSAGEDYHFVLGGRYEIDPQNSVSPFLVNDCSATTLLSIASAPPVPSSAPPPSPIGSPVPSAQLTAYPTASAHPDFVTGAVFVVLAAVLVGVAFLLRVVRRRFRQRT